MSEDTVRLACVKHTASVHPEPGSNSPFCCVLSLVSETRLYLFRNPSYNFLVSLDLVTPDQTYLTRISYLEAFKVLYFYGSVVDGAFSLAFTLI